MHRILAFVHTVVIAMAMLLGFLTMAAMHRYNDLGPVHYVGVDGNEGGASTEEVVAALTALSEERPVAVMATRAAPRDLDGGMELYVLSSVPGSDMRSWAENGYPNFTPVPQLRVHALAELDEDDPRGSYWVEGTAADAELVLGTLESVGLSGEIDPALSVMARYPGTIIFNEALGTMLLLVLAFVTATTGAGVLLNARAYGVRRLHGHSYGRILAADLRGVTRAWLLLAPTSTAAFAVFLWWYNGFARVGELAAVTAVFAVLLLAAALASHAAALALLHLTAVPTAIKGRLPVRSVAVSAYAVRIASVALVLVSATATFTYGERVAEHQAGLDSLTGTEEMGAPRIGGGADMEESFEAYETIVGPWIVDADARGEVIMVEQKLAQDVLTPEVRATGIDVLSVNETYLAHAGVDVGEAALYGPGVRILVPESLTGYSDHLVNGVQYGAEYSAAEEHRDGPVTVLTYPDGHTFPTYATTSDLTWSIRPVLTDPVVIVHPPGYFDGGMYATIASGGGIVFLDGDAAARDAAEPPLSSYIVAVESIPERAALDHHRWLGDLRMNVFNLAASVAVLALTSVAACLVYTRARAQHIFARHISGWSFAATHRGFLLVEVGLVALFVGYAAKGLWDALADFRVIELGVFESDVVRAQAQFALSAAIGVAVLAIVLGVLAYFHRRIVREGASQA
ncbi:hypothetical protein [Nocardiopsis sp. CC223A]|uniref:hypothetical protein n=1 Tax=Nocardiopsis sp. CC223A TaxID=3044051 RepID=UPI00278C4E7E|nr:hypothetical protein [Nocardiopsis sp. CC223A]